MTNVGNSTVVLAYARIDNQPANMTIVWASFAPLSLAIPKGECACVQISRTTPFCAGTEYLFTIVTWNNTEFSVTGASESRDDQLQLGNPWNWNTNTNSVYINMTNIGSSTVVIASAHIDNNPATLTAIWLSSSATPSLTIPKGECACIQISRTTAFTAGVNYTFTIVTHNQKEFSVNGVAQGS